jgi:glycosyltransferase involved in cell wall biosynthesis
VRIRFIGQKGIPARFGGVESHVESLAGELAARGHDVAVYVRPWYTPRELKTYLGVRLIRLPTLNTKHGDAAVHSFLCSVQAIFSDAGIIHYHAIGPAFFSIIPRLFGKKVVVTVHRLDWEAAKWGPVARLLLKAGEYVSVKVPHRTIVVSAELQAHIRKKYGKETVHIAHGRSKIEPAAPRTITRKYSLRGRDYILFLGRFSPEKRVDWLLDSYREMKKSCPRARGVKLVLAGGSSATDDYVRKLTRSGGDDPDIIFTGYVTGREKSELLTNALLFVLPSSLEGSPVALLEAFGHGLCCLASDIPPHREAIRPGEDGLLFKHSDRADLTRKMTQLISDRTQRQRLGRAAKAKVSRAPGWKEVARRHEMLYNEIVPEAARPKKRRPA